MWEDDDDINEDDQYDPEKEQRRVESLPIYQKAEEIRELTRQIIDSIDNQEIRVLHSNIMLEDSIIIPIKIAGAEAVSDYESKMENATLIKMHARSLERQSESLVFQDILPKDYLVLLRKEVETFRLLFCEWVRSFKNAPRTDDGWGLFTDDNHG